MHLSVLSGSLCLKVWTGVTLELGNNLHVIVKFTDGFICRIISVERKVVLRLSHPVATLPILQHRKPTAPQKAALISERASTAHV